MTLYFVQCVKEGRTVWRILAQNPMELGARLGKPCNKILRNLIHVHKYVLAYACVYVARCQRMLQAYVTDVVEYVFMFLENISTFLKKVSMFQRICLSCSAYITPSLSRYSSFSIYPFILLKTHSQSSG